MPDSRAVRRLLLVATCILAATVLLVSPASSASRTEQLAASAPLPTLTVKGPENGPPRDGVGGLVISWNTGIGVLAGLERSIDGGAFVRIGQFDPVITVTTDGAPAAAKQVFRLSQAGTSSKVLVMATLQNGQYRVDRVARPVPPRDTAAWIDTLVQYAPYAIIAFFGVLTALYLRSLRGLREVADAA